ncbi:DUF4283 domain-containing protein [Abeliophyllum distichum]|uniref:DUF4283 domain-containing protein n=1 Tax=Abeliophyllum distichum TaxID=126358 RepID=A0ABD1PAP9_9LAMI
MGKKNRGVLASKKESMAALKSGSSHQQVAVPAASNDRVHSKEFWNGLCSDNSPVHPRKEQGNQVSSSFPPLPMKKIPVEGNLSLVSPSISVTLGDFDTESEGTSGNNAPAKGETLGEKLPLQKESKAPWVNLFKDNRKPKESLALRVYENLPDRVELDLDDEDDLELTWGHCLIGYFAGRFPGKKALLNLCSSWDVEYEYHTHESGWLVFKFHDEASRDKVLKGGPYFVFGRPLLLKVMPKYFRFNDKEISLMPVWVVLPKLPLTYWNPKVLGKIASKIGKPISMDNLTSLRGRISYARVLVEIDAAKDLVRTVNVGLPNGDVFDQEVIYEHEPKFCSFCRMFGHSSKSCALYSQEKPSSNAAAQVHKTGTETQLDVLISGTEGQPEVLNSGTDRQTAVPISGNGRQPAGQISGTKVASKGTVSQPMDVPNPPAVVTSFELSQAQTVDVLPIIVSAESQGQPLEVEGDDVFIVVERKKKLTAAQKGKQQAKEQVSDSGGKAKAPYKAIGKETSKLSRTNDLPAKKGRSSLSLDKSKGHTLPLSS